MISYFIRKVETIDRIKIIVINNVTNLTIDLLFFGFLFIVPPLNILLVNH